MASTVTRTCETLRISAASRHRFHGAIDNHDPELDAARMMKLKYGLPLNVGASRLSM
jgi:hypothetical protein